DPPRRRASPAPGRTRRGAADRVSLPPAVRLSLPRGALRLRIDRGIARGADGGGHRGAVLEALLLDPQASHLRATPSATPSRHVARAWPRQEARAVARAPAPCHASSRLNPQGGGGVAQRRLLLLAHQRAADAEEAALLRGVRHSLCHLL